MVLRESLDTTLENVEADTSFGELVSLKSNFTRKRSFLESVE